MNVHFACFKQVANAAAHSGSKAERCVATRVIYNIQIMKCSSSLHVWILLLVGPYLLAQASEDRPDASPKPKLLRSEAKRWDRVHQIVRSEIKAATKKFLTDRDQVYLQVDI